jgi:uncharacterized protein
MRIGLISDTHGKLRPQVFDAFADVELILHAGDVGGLDIIDELETIAPVHAVMGNTDSSALRPRVQDELSLGAGGASGGGGARAPFGSPQPGLLRAAYPDADVIVYGHTHRQRVDVIDGCVIVNPGAAGAARFDLKPAVAILTLVEGEAPAVEHVALG